LTIVFASNRPGGPGGADLWLSTRSTRGAAFSAPTALLDVDTAAGEGDPCLASDGRTLYFVSRRGGSMSDDLFTATRAPR
jgi:Tol biopolymer transport system component